MQQSPLHSLFLRRLGHIDLFEGIGVELRIEHGCGYSARSRVEVLYLFGAYLVFLEKNGKVYRRVKGAAGV